MRCFPMGKKQYPFLVLGLLLFYNSFFNIGYGYSLPKIAQTPLPQELQNLLKIRKIALDAPIALRIFKEERILEIWKADRKGLFHYIYSYPICAVSGKLGPKYTFADMQAPEGFYTVALSQLNPYSRYTLAFNVGYPNPYDKQNARDGGAIMVHGGCKSSGCFAMGDENILEIYAFVRDALKGGQKEISLQIYPFHLDWKNLHRYKDDPNYSFWVGLKKAEDIFEKTHYPPKVKIVNKSYVFEAVSPKDRIKPSTKFKQFKGKLSKEDRKKLEAFLKKSVHRGPLICAKDPDAPAQPTIKDAQEAKELAQEKINALKDAL